MLYLVKNLVAIVVLSELKSFFSLSNFANESCVLLASEASLGCFEESDGLLQIGELARSVHSDKGILERVNSGYNILDKSIVKLNQVCSLIKDLFT